MGGIEDMIGREREEREERNGEGGTGYITLYKML